MGAVDRYNKMQQETDFDGTWDDFVELCHPDTHACPEGNCDLIWTLIADYEEAWFDADKTQGLQEGSEYRVSDLTNMKLADLKKVSRWIAWVLSQDPRHRAK